MKTSVEIISSVNQSMIEKGDIGYIDGYLRAADGRGYAVVVIPSKGIIDYVPFHSLKMLGVIHD